MKIGSFVSGAVAFMAATLLAGGAFAKDFGSPGTVELGGAVGFSSGSEKFSQGGLSATVTSTGLSLIPQVGYFVSDGLEIGGTLDIGFANSKDSGAFSGSDNTTTMGLGVKGGYYFKVGDSGARLGPALTIEYLNIHDKFDDGSGTTSTSTNSGPGFAPGADLKVPVGGSGLITVGLDYLIYNGSISFTGGGPNEDDKLSELNTNVGFSVFF